MLNGWRLTQIDELERVRGVLANTALSIFLRNEGYARTDVRAIYVDADGTYWILLSRYAMKYGPHH